MTLILALISPAVAAGTPFGTKGSAPDSDASMGFDDDNPFGVLITVLTHFAHEYLL
jgi:hypothetical protein